MGGKTRTRRKAAQGAGVGGGWTRRGPQSADLPLGLSLSSAPLRGGEAADAPLSSQAGQRGVRAARRGAGRSARASRRTCEGPPPDASKTRRLKLQGVNSAQNLGNRLGFRGHKGPPGRRGGALYQQRTLPNPLADSALCQALSSSVEYCGTRQTTVEHATRLHDAGPDDDATTRSPTVAHEGHYVAE